jgi:enoyl-[acyl-carrier protein] reductase I
MLDVSVGPLGSRAAKAIGFIEKMIEYSYINAPLQKELLAGEMLFISVYVTLSCLI